MASPEQRPRSIFYADINDPYFPSDYFDPLSAIINDHHTLYRQAIEHGHAEPFDTSQASPEHIAQYERTDFAVQVPDVDGYAWQVVDRGGDLYQALVERGALRADRPDYVIGNGPDADKSIDETLQELDISVNLVNTDGVALGSQPGSGEYIENSESISAYRHVGRQLFDAGLAQVYQHELLYHKEGKPTVAHPREHYQFGLRTAIGFVPLVTLLDGQHPVMAQIIANAQQKRLKTPEATLEKPDLAEFERHRQELLAQQTEQPQGWPFTETGGEDTIT